MILAGMVAVYFVLVLIWLMLDGGWYIDSIQDIISFPRFARFYTLEPGCWTLLSVGPTYYSKKGDFTHNFGFLPINFFCYYIWFTITQKENVLDKIEKELEGEEENIDY